MIKNEENVIRCGLKWPQNNKLKHNNQPKTCGRDGAETGYEVQPAGAWGERKFIILGQSSWGIMV
jgi:hypothetical protein